MRGSGARLEDRAVVDALTRVGHVHCTQQDCTCPAVSKCAQGGACLVDRAGNDALRVGRAAALHRVRLARAALPVAEKAHLRMRTACRSAGCLQHLALPLHSCCSELLPKLDGTPLQSIVLVAACLAWVYKQLALYVPTPALSLALVLGTHCSPPSADRTSSESLIANTSARLACINNLSHTLSPGSGRAL